MKDTQRGSLVNTGSPLRKNDGDDAYQPNFCHCTTCGARSFVGDDAYEGEDGRPYCYQH
jgi:hypothetical protein